MVIQNLAQRSDERKDAEESFMTCPATILNAIPSDCEKISFSELKLGENYKDKAIVGKICHLNPLGKRATGFIRKLLMTDALEDDSQDQMKLPVFLLDEFAQDSDVAEIGSYVIITNFLLEKSTHCKSIELPFQVLVKKDESQVLFGRKIPSPKLKSSDKQKSVKKKTLSDDDVECEHPSRKKKKCQTEEDVNILSNQYDYISLEELHETEPKQTFNVYGIVEKCDLKVLQGKRTQILDLVLSDKTETGFICSIFAAKDEVFPDIYPGDVIRIHRMQVYKFRSRLKGKCLSSKFILVFSKSNKGLKPRTVAKSFTYTAEDSFRVQKLFEWYDKKSELKLISELNRGDFGNIVCQVIGVYCAKTTDAVILKVWDGTKTNQFESSHYGFKDERLDEKLFLIARNYYVVLSVYGQYGAVAGELRPGQFIEVQNAHLFCSKTNPDDCKLCLHTGNKEGRGIKVLEDGDERVKELKLRLERIISEVQEFGSSQTDDILSQNNSIFLNCDFSAIASSQHLTQNKKVADVDTLNRPFSSKGDTALSQNTIISVLDASVVPGQSTQEFGEGMSQEFQAKEILTENQISEPHEPDPVINKTPMEFRKFLHDPEREKTSAFLPVNKETDQEHSSQAQAISEVGEYARIKPSSISEIVRHDVPYKFRILCAVMSYKPDTNSIQHLIHLCCPECLYMTKDAFPVIEPFEERGGLFYFYCPECSLNEVDKQKWPVLEYTYLIVFDLHDGTQSSSLQVCLWRENAVQFFKGITAEQALTDKTATDSIFRMLWSICPNCRPFDSSAANENSFIPYPMLDCCITSYATESGTMYQMFNTILK